MVHGNSLGWILTEQPNQPSAANLEGKICEVHNADGHGPVSRSAFAGARLALYRRTAHGRGHESSHASDIRSLRRNLAESGRRSGAHRRALEIRIQEHQIDRQHRVRWFRATDGLEHRNAARLRLLLQRQSRGRPPAVESGYRTPYWRVLQAEDFDV